MSDHLTIIIDDDKVVLMILEQAFQELGYPVLTFGDGQAGLDALKQHETAVIISDYNMPGLSGIEVLKKAREISPDTTRILISGTLNLELALQAVCHGEVYRLLSKPWKPLEFRSTLHQSFEKYDLIKENHRLHEELLEQTKVEATQATVVTLHHRINNSLLSLCSDIGAMDHAFKRNETPDDYPELLARMKLCYKQIRDVVARLAVIEKVEMTEYSDDTMMIDTEKSA